MRILYGVSSAATASAFLRGQLGYMTSKGHRVRLAAPDSDGELRRLCAREGARLLEVPFTRRPNVRADIIALAMSFRVIQSEKPDVLIAGTPKASLLLLFAGWLLKVPHRVYLCHGLRHEGLEGRARWAFALIERFLCGLSTHVIAVSRSVSYELVCLGASPGKVRVLGAGSANGIDVKTFRPASSDERSMLRRAEGFSDSQIICLFVGRITRDKGLKHLAYLVEKSPDLTLLIAGIPEPSGENDRALIAELKAASNVHFLGQRNDVSDLMRLSDLLLLPTRREGLPTVAIEAAASGLPVVAMQATGTVDAILHGITGFLVPQGDSEKYHESVVSLAGDKELRDKLGRCGRRFAAVTYPNEVVWSNWADFLGELHSDSEWGVS